MGTIKYYSKYDIYINSSFKQRIYSKQKAINICQQLCSNLFTGHRHGEVVDADTGEIIYSL